MRVENEVLRVDEILEVVDEVWRVEDEGLGVGDDRSMRGRVEGEVFEDEDLGVEDELSEVGNEYLGLRMWRLGMKF